MSDTPITELEQQLTALTAWTGPAQGLWRRALATSRAGAKGAGRAWRLPWRVPGWAWGMSAAAAVFIAVGLAMRAQVPLRELERRAVCAANEAGVGTGMKICASDNSDWLPHSRYSATGAPGAGLFLLTVDGMPDTRQFVCPSSGDSEDDLRNSAGGSTGSLTDRQVVRKAQMELLAKDVRATFLKASHLISEAQGEYVQDSSVTGSGERVEAHLTLRVAATRLADVLNELRGLGEVRSEQTGGEDVTGQVVDVEARLRNERQVEAELLKLLESRQNAPLKEILEARTSLGSVRQAIEVLTAQRDKLGRLVSLATVLVIIRPADAPPPKPPPGLAAYLGQSLLDGLHRGALFLINTLATIAGVLVGGLVWWVLLVVAVLIVRGYRRRRSATAG